MARNFRRHQDVDAAAGEASRSPTTGTSVDADGLLEEHVSDKSALAALYGALGASPEPGFSG